MKSKHLKVKVKSINAYGSSGSMITINVDDVDYTFTTTNTELAEEASYENSYLHKEALNYLVAKTLLHHEFEYETFELIK